MEDFTLLQESLKSVTDPIGFLVSIFAYAPVGFAIWKPDGHLLLVNKAFQEMFGSTPPPDYNILKDDVVAESGIPALIQGAFEGQAAHVPTFWYDARDLKNVTVLEGKRVAVSMSVFPLQNQQGVIEFVAAVYRDETEVMLSQEILEAEGEHLRQLIAEMEQEAAERKRAEQAVIESERHFKALIQNSADVVQLVSAEGIIIYVSPAVSRVLDFTPEEMTGRSVGEFIHPEEFNALQQQFMEIVRQPSLTVKVEQRVRHKDNSWRWVEVTATNLMHDPAVKALVVNYHDITERKNAAQQQMRAALQRERLVLMNDFVQAISHDFRTSLATIETSRYLLQRGLDLDDKEKAQSRLNVIQQYVFHMEEQLENLRALAALANLKLEPCDLNSLVNTVISEQSLRVRQHHHQIIFQPDAQLPGIRADAHELGRAIRHVLVNALSYMDSEGIVTIRTFSADQIIALQIQDSGIGIAPEHLPHIFDLFYRVEAARPLDSGGVGLGLSIVRMIVEAHGGSVKMDSVLNEGSTFTLYIPVAAV